MPKFAIRAEHFVKEGAMNRWLQLAQMNSKESLNEPGCHRFDVLVDRSDPNHGLLYEVYEDRTAWLRHCEQPHFRKFVKEVQDLFVKRVREEFDLLT